MPYIGLIEPDDKTAEQIDATLSPFCKEKNGKLIRFKSTTELDEWLSQGENSNDSCLLLVMHVNLADLTTEIKIRAVKEKYKCDVLATAFEDTKASGKMIQSLPVENIVYKPFDVAILFEHVRFAVQKSDLLKPVSVHSLSEKCEIEKIRRFELVALSDFAMICKTSSELVIGHAYKIYHPLFLNQTKTSARVRLIHKDNELHYFTFCHLDPQFSQSLRKRIAESKSKLKSADWKPLQLDEKILAPKVFIQLQDQDEKQKLLDYFARKFPQALVTDWTPNPKDPKTECHLLISDQNWTVKLLEQYFIKRPMLYGIQSLAKSEAEIRSVLEVDYIRTPLPIDRNFFGKVFTTLFPDVTEVEPATTNWITHEQKALQSEPVEVQQLSEAAFVYNRTPVLPRGSLQEFALTEDDETELKPILAKTQFAIEKPNQDGTFTHQIVFYGIRDASLKKLRLWMRLRHIQAQNKS